MLGREVRYRGAREQPPHSQRRRAEQHLHSDLGLKELFVHMHGRHALTFPVWRPLLPVDRIYFRGLNPAACRRLSAGPWRELSDHAALFGEFRL